MIIAATGHRPNKLCGYSENAEARVLKLAVLHFRFRRPKTAISGMAEGWDMAIAEAAIMHDIPLICAIPFAGQEKLWSAIAQRRYQIILACAKEVVIVSEGGYEAWKYQKRNEWMVERADRLVALWDGTEGGTHNCLCYAAQVGKEFDNLWEQYVKLAA